MPLSTLVSVMDSGTQRVLAKKERAYDIALELVSELERLYNTTAETAPVSNFAALWFHVSDLFDDHRGPMSEEMCESFATAVANAWKALPKRDDEQAQMAFVRKWDKALGRFWRAGKLPS